MAEQNMPKRNALSEFSLRLIGDPVNGEKRPPTLGVVVRKNRPILEVRTNVTNDKDYGRIQARMTTPTFNAFLEILKEVAEAAGETKRTITLSDFKFIRNQGRGERSKEPMVEAKVVIGKDKDGVVYIACLSWEQGRPIIKFPFRNTAFEAFTDEHGNPVTPAYISVIYARSWVRLLTQMVPFVLQDEYWEKPRDDQQGGGQGGGNRSWGGGGGQGGGNRGGGGGGGYSGGGQGGGGGSAAAASDGLDEDAFPF